MKLIIYLLALYVSLFSVQPVFASSVREELVALAKQVDARDKRFRAERELNQRVQREAERLGVVSDPDRLYALRLILLVFGDEGRTAVAVAKSESGLRCHAVGDGGESVGLFQINKVHWGKWDRDSLFDCETNVRAAYEIWQDSGWWPWTVYRLGIHRQFL